MQAADNYFEEPVDSRVVRAAGTAVDLRSELSVVRFGKNKLHCRQAVFRNLSKIS